MSFTVYGDKDEVVRMQRGPMASIPLKESLAAREEMRKLREEIECKEECFSLLADKVDKNTMADAETQAELQGLQAGEERRSSNASQAVECCLETMVEQIFALGTGARDENAQNGPIYFSPELFSYCVFSVPDTFLPLRWPDCTLSRLRAEEYDRLVTQSIATPEPSSWTIPALDRTLVAP